jgi:hypothetical protein
LDDAVRSALARVLWIGGGQWAGKTSVAHILIARYPLLFYAYDYHDARSHAARSRADPARYPSRHAFFAALDRHPDEVWVTPPPEAMAEGTLHSFRERFAMVVEDLARMPPGPPILADGWGLRPDLVAPLLDSPRKAVFLVPSEEFRQHQIRTLPRAGALQTLGVSDPEGAQRNRVERDRILASDVVETARRHGLRVIVVDGGLDLPAVTALVEEHFRPFLPSWLY